MNDWQRSPLNWQQFQRSLFPGLNGGDMNPQDVQSFVQNTINRYVPKSMLNELVMPPFQAGGVGHEVFETHRAVFVRFRLPEEISLKEFRVFINKRTLKLEGPDQAQEVLLPADVLTASATAKFHDGVLEVRMPKSKDTEPLREIFIRDGS